MNEHRYIFTVLKEVGDIEDKIVAFALPDTAKGTEEKFLREVIHDFLISGMGKQSLIETQNTFGWDDVSSFIPQSFWAEYSIFPLYSNGNGPYNMSNFSFKDFSIVTVSSNEILCD